LVKKNMLGLAGFDFYTALGGHGKITGFAEGNEGPQKKVAEMQRRGEEAFAHNSTTVDKGEETA